MKYISEEEFQKRYGTAGVSMFKKPKEESAFGNRVKTTAKSGWEKIKTGARQAGDSGKKGSLVDFGEGILKLGAGAVEAGFSPLTAAVEPVVKPTLGRAVEFAADKISDNTSFQRFADSGAGRLTSRITEDINDLNTIAGAVTGPKGVTRGASTAFKAGENALVQAGENVVAKTGQMVEKGLKPMKGVIDSTKNIAGFVTDEAKRIPNRIATNFAEKQATQGVINKLPSRIAKEGARDGLEVPDVQYIYKIPKAQKAQLKKLATIVKDFAEGKTKTNPIEVVGKPIVNKIKELETASGVVGKKLGKVAENLGEVTAQEAFPKVFASLKKINGLSGLKVSPKGVLDFAETVLTTAETKADRLAIQRMFIDAIKKGSGKSKHLLRQELFEVLGGKKRSLTNLTATQEKAFEAIRSGLSDVLESKNPTYKALSNQYRKMIQPLQDIRKFMKGTVNATEDVLDMKAGLLARRLTSFAASNPEIRNILNAMDKATKVAGKTRLSMETLQDFYNILEKYYDIAPKTGYQAQTKLGVEKAIGGPVNYISEKINSLAGQTPKVRQKALEKILEEVFK